MVTSDCDFGQSFEMAESAHFNVAVLVVPRVHIDPHDAAVLQIDPIGLS